MSEYVIQGQTLTGIADAIRAQLGTEQQYTPESMAAAIGSIQGGTEIEDALISRSIKGTYTNDRVTYVGYNAFANCQSLKSVFLPTAENIDSSAFNSCISLEYAKLTATTRLGGNCFAYCSKLKYIYISKVVTILSLCFNSCTSLTAVILSVDGVCSLSNSNAFAGTPIASGTGYIYVPDDLVDQYKVATNWATYADQIKGLSEIPAEVQQWLDQQGGASA